MKWKNLLIRTNKGETSSKQENGKGGEQKKGEEHATKAGNKPGKPNKGRVGVVSFVEDLKEPMTAQMKKN